jgi:hypothetical protein
MDGILLIVIQSENYNLLRKYKKRIFVMIHPVMFMGRGIEERGGDKSRHNDDSF